MQQFHPHPYQQAGIDAILEKPGVALWMEMGLGKTVVTLTAIDQLIYDRLEISRVLIVAPKKVAEATWQDEAAKWEHLQHLRISTVLGTEKQRKAALEAPADIYIINRENVPWLVHTLGRSWNFDMVVLDEASSFKNHAAQRFKALKAVRPRIHKVVELTGTPRPNSLLDLWAQIYLLDQGERLGRYITHYRKDYFWPTEYSYEPKDGAAEAVEGRIKDIVLSFKAADHLTLPEKIIDDIPVVLDKPAKAAYKKLEKDYLLDVDGETITAQQAAALTGKLLQLCNGSIYDEGGTVHPIHRCKLDAFDELIDALDGQKALVFYGFRFDEEHHRNTESTPQGPQICRAALRAGCRRLERGKAGCSAGPARQLRLRPEPAAGRASPDLVQPAVESGALRPGRSTALPAGPDPECHRPPADRQGRCGRDGGQGAEPQGHRPEQPDAGGKDPHSGSEEGRQQVSTRAFRRLSRAERRGFINTIEDPLTRRAFEIVFLGPGKVSWRKAALLYGGGISPETLRVWVWQELQRA